MDLIPCRLSQMIWLISTHSNLCLYSLAPLLSSKDIFYGDTLKWIFYIATK